ncbi:MAG: hypothetical protein KAI73_08665 [Rhodospirillaceae bacterium]|nr:hypothetical protein [Rhodospirillaceae bacterium]
MTNKHPIEAGATVTVHNQTASGKDIVEGEAKIIKHIEGDEIAHLYEVEFKNEPGETYERWLT